MSTKIPLSNSQLKTDADKNNLLEVVGKIIEDLFWDSQKEEWLKLKRPTKMEVPMGIDTEQSSTLVDWDFLDMDCDNPEIYTNIYIYI